MSIATLKTGKRRFVVVPQRDFDRMQRDNRRYAKLRDEERALGELAMKELRAFRKSGGRGTPWAEVKRELGLCVENRREVYRGLYGDGATD